MKFNKENFRGNISETGKNVFFLDRQVFSSVFSLHYLLDLYSFAKQIKQVSLSARAIGKLSAIVYFN